jgi:hypothetical protein
MSGPSQSSPSSGKLDDLLVYVQRLRHQAQEFQRTIEEEIRLTREQIIEERARQAKRRRP